MREIVRRLILLGGLTAGLWLCGWAEPQLYRVQPVDWGKERQRKEGKREQLVRFATAQLGRDVSHDASITNTYAETRLQLQKFIAHETDGFLTTVGGSEWAGFFNAVADTVLGKPPSTAWRQRNARWPYGGSLYFQPGEAPLNALAGQLTPDHPLRYVRIENGPRAEYLAVTRSARQDLFSHAPQFLVFPHRLPGVLVVLVVFLLYVLLPRARPPAAGMHYAGARAIVMPDMLGAVTGGFFFVLPILVPQANSGDSPLAPGWNILTGAMWLLAAIVFTSCFVGAWYASQYAAVTADGVVCGTLTGCHRRRWNELERLKAFEKPMIPPWLRKLLLVVSIFDRRALSPALMYSGTETGLRLVFKDGRHVAYYPRGLVGAAPFVGRLRDQGVPIEPEVYAALGVRPDAPALAAPFPAEPRRIGFLVFSTLVCLALAFLAVRWNPPPAPVIRPAALRAQAFAFPAEPDVRTLLETLRQNERILGQMQVLRKQMDQLDQRMKTAAPEERKRLMAEFRKVIAEFDRLYAQSEAIHDPAAATNAAGPPSGRSQ